MIWMEKLICLNKIVCLPIRKATTIFIAILIVKFATVAAAKPDEALGQYRTSYFKSDIATLTNVSEKIYNSKKTTEGFSEESWYLFLNLMLYRSMDQIRSDYDLGLTNKEYFSLLESEAFQSGDSFLFICGAISENLYLQGHRGDAEFVMSHCSAQIHKPAYISSEYYMGFVVRWMYILSLRGDKAAAYKAWKLIRIIDQQGWLIDDEQSGLTLSLMTESLMFLDQYELLLSVGKAAALDDLRREESIFINNRRRVFMAVQAYASLKGRPFPEEIISTTSNTDDHDWNATFNAFVKVVDDISAGRTSSKNVVSTAISGLEDAGYGTIASAIQLQQFKERRFIERLKRTLHKQEIFKSNSFSELTGGVSITLMDKLFYELIFRAIEKHFPKDLPEVIEDILVDHFSKTSFSQLDTFSRFQNFFDSRQNAAQFVISREVLFDKIFEHLESDLSSRLFDEKITEDMLEALYSQGNAVMKATVQVLSLSKMMHERKTSKTPPPENHTSLKIRNILGPKEAVLLLRYIDERILSCVISSQGNSCKIGKVSAQEHEKVLSVTKRIPTERTETVISALQHMRNYFFNIIDYGHLSTLESLYIFSNEYSQLPWTALLADDLKTLQFANTDISILASLVINSNSFESEFEFEYYGVGDISYKRVAEVQPELLAGFPTSGTRGVRLSALPETKTEITAISKNFSDKPVRILFGEQANIDNIFGTYSENNLSARVIHLATHALGAQPDRGIDRPSLALAPSQDDDGLISDLRIASSSIHSEIVILSACTTVSDSSLSNGSELVGLASAFIMAGASGVAATLWDVNSEKTVGYMVEVSQELKTSTSFLAAMRRARNKLYEADPTSISSWASFTHVTTLRQ